MGKGREATGTLPGMQMPNHNRAAASSGLVEARDGTTVVELLVALVIVTIGLLALAGAAALVARETGRGHRELALARAARTRLERLTSTPCAALASGSVTANGIAERWTVGEGRNGVRRLVVTVEALAPAGGARIVRRLEGSLPCA